MQFEAIGGVIDYMKLKSYLNSERENVGKSDGSGEIKMFNMLATQDAAIARVHTREKPRETYVCSQVLA